MADCVSSSREFRLAHISDTHLTIPGLYDDVDFSVYPKKARLVARFKKPEYFPVEIFRRVVDVLADENEGVNHTVFTGDLSVLAFDEEFALNRGVIDERFCSFRRSRRVVVDEGGDLGDAEIEGEEEEEATYHNGNVFAEKWTVLPGNHDYYFPSNLEEDYFGKHFRDSFGECIPPTEEESLAQIPDSLLQYPFVKLLLTTSPSADCDPVTTTSSTNTSLLHTSSADILLICFNSRVAREGESTAKGEIDDVQISKADRLVGLVEERLGPGRSQNLLKIVAIHHNPIKRFVFEFIENYGNLCAEDRERMALFCARHRVALCLCGHTHFFHVGMMNETVVVDGGSCTFVGHFLPRTPGFSIFHFVREERMDRGMEQEGESESGEEEEEETPPFRLARMVRKWWDVRKEQFYEVLYVRDARSGRLVKAS